MLRQIFYLKNSVFTKDGKLITEEIKEYIKKVKNEYKSLNLLGKMEFRAKKSEIINEFEAKGVIWDALVEESGGMNHLI